MQNDAYILPVDLTLMRELLAYGEGSILRVSLAPELPGADELIVELREHGVGVSLAHTGATLEQALHAVELGATQVTHCFNAMTGLHHRQPGMVGAAMLSDDLTVELIADGVHVHPAAMRILIDQKGRERVMLVTDAMSATDMAEGQYLFGGHTVTVGGGVARLHDGTLASSTLTMEAAVRNVVELCAVPLVDAVYMASTVPASAIGFGGSKGRIAVGYDADLAVLDTSLRPVATWIAGERVV
jgi:N-acetylglucosamine-6-phosphate deacetylase